MKKLILLIILLFSFYGFIRADNVNLNCIKYQFFFLKYIELQPNKYQIDLKNTFKDFDDWLYTIARSIKGQRLQIAYKLDFGGNVCIICGFYAWNGLGWVSVMGGNDEKGYYVYYWGTKYYF